MSKLSDDVVHIYSKYPLDNNTQVQSYHRELTHDNDNFLYNKTFHLIKIYVTLYTMYIEYYQIYIHLHVHVRYMQRFKTVRWYRALLLPVTLLLTSYMREPHNITTGHKHIILIKHLKIIQGQITSKLKILNIHLNIEWALLG